MCATRRTVLKFAAGAMAAAQANQLSASWLSIPGSSLQSVLGSSSADIHPGLFSVAGFYPVPDGPRQVVNFNPGWRFLKSDAPGAEKIDFDDAHWESAPRP
jgi:hypothetical protein